jgi:glucose-fructose oxidoreductase
LTKSNGSSERIRYAVVGLGHIAQVAVLPAFAHAQENSELVALVSGDDTKLNQLGRRYRVRDLFSYDQYEDCLTSGLVDAVYIALPNSMHCEFTERAAMAGVHVLVEKPMAVTRSECRSMILAAQDSGIKLMVAYRLHFDPANLEAIKIAHSGKLGELRYFSSTFSMQVRQDNIRLQGEEGAGPLHDIGIYCLNAARGLFRDEPEGVYAEALLGHDARFGEVPEAYSVVLRFPNERVASFTCSFGAADMSAYDLVGTKGRLRLDPAYEYADSLELETEIDGKKRHKTFPKHDQFAPEIVTFSNCILNNAEPEPSAMEGLLDVWILEALMESSRTGRALRLDLPRMDRPPHPSQKMRKPPVREPQLVRARSASR